MTTLISTPQDLYNVRNNLAGDYELTNDIDMSSWGNFNPIGNASNKFTGHIDGKGFKIKNLTINVTSANVGFISYLENGSISNLAIENGNVTSNGYNNVGILVGATNSASLISKCYTTGSVSGQYGVGGLVGWSYFGNIDNCFSHASVFSAGRAGGLIGHRASSVDLVINCYSTGLVTVTPNPDLYSGGLIGSYEYLVTNSYYDTVTSGRTISAGGTGLTTSQMKIQSSYVNWDFTNIWGINNDYPYLQVFGVTEVPTKKETINVSSHLNTIQSESERNTATKRNLVTYTIPINTSVIKSSRSVRSSTQIVTSFINPISASVERRSKTFVNLLSYIKPLQADLTVLYSMNVFTPNAYVSVLENTSRVVKMENMSSVSYVVNPSFSEVIK